MKVNISPGFLKGEVVIPPSKSYTHRALICAALSKGRSTIKNVIFSEDVLATIDALKSIGTKFEIKEDSITIDGTEKIEASQALVDCNESGSTLRFMIPILCMSHQEFSITGKASLLKRPMSIYENIIKDLSGTYEPGNDSIRIRCDFIPKDYYIKGNVSSQFISGLLFILPTLDGDSRIIIEGDFESKNYVEMTIHMLNHFGIKVTLESNQILIKGNQSYKANDYYIECDYSQLALFAVAVY